MASFAALNTDILICIAQVLPVRDLISLSQSHRRCLLISLKYASYWTHATIEPAYLDRVAPLTAYAPSELRIAALRNIQSQDMWMKNSCPELKTGVKLLQYGQEQSIYIVPGTRWMFSYDAKSLLCSDLRTGSMIGRLGPPSELLAFNEYQPIRSGCWTSPNEVYLVISLVVEEDPSAAEMTICIYHLKFTHRELPTSLATELHPHGLKQVLEDTVSFQIHILPKRFVVDLTTKVVISGDGRLLALATMDCLELYDLVTGKKHVWTHADGLGEVLIFHQDLLVLLPSNSVKLLVMHVPSIINAFERFSTPFPPEMDAILGESPCVGDIVDSDPMSIWELVVVGGVESDLPSGREDNIRQNTTTLDILWTERGTTCFRYSFLVTLDPVSPIQDTGTPSNPATYLFVPRFSPDVVSKDHVETTVQLYIFSTDTIELWAPQRTIIWKKYHPMIDAFIYNMHVTGVDPPRTSRSLIPFKEYGDKSVPWILSLEETSKVVIMKDGTDWVACWFA